MPSVFTSKSLLLSTVLISTMAVAVKILLTTSMVPTLYESLISWFTPPYLYIVVNSIILSIAASSRFHRAPEADEGTLAVSCEEAEVVKFSPLVVEEQLNGLDVDVDEKKEEKNDVDDEEEEVKAQGEDEFVISRSSWTPSRSRATEEISLEKSDAVEEKPLASARFSTRRSAKQSPKGKALGVARPGRSESALESTWKTITDGCSVPLRKVVTFEEQPSSPASSQGSRGKGNRWEASPGHDDLNKRVEAFIKKFNEEMRQQSQESFRHYQQIVVNRER